MLKCWGHHWILSLTAVLNIISYFLKLIYCWLKVYCFWFWVFTTTRFIYKTTQLCILKRTACLCCKCPVLKSVKWSMSVCLCIYVSVCLFIAFFRWCFILNLYSHRKYTFFSFQYTKSSHGSFSFSSKLNTILFLAFKQLNNQRHHIICPPQSCFISVRFFSWKWKIASESLSKTTTIKQIILYVLTHGTLSSKSLLE